MQQITVNIPDDLYDELVKYSEMTNLPLDAIVNISLSHFLTNDILKVIKAAKEREIEELMHLARKAELVARHQRASSQPLESKVIVKKAVSEDNSLTKITPLPDTFQPDVIHTGLIADDVPTGI